MKKLLLTGAFNYTEEQIGALSGLGFEIVFVEDERKPLDIEVGNIYAVVCNSLFQYNSIEKFNSLRVIQLTSAGMDRVPRDYIEKAGITLFNAKGVYSIPMAEWVVLKILEIYKKSRKFYENQTLHKWEKQRDLLELTDKTAAIIGFGSVGQETAKRLKAFGVYIIAVDIMKVQADFIDEFVMFTDIDEVLGRADITVLSLPLNNDTLHMFDKDRIGRIKDKAVFINVSRGSVVNESDLINALKQGKFIGVALDVFENEPLGDSPLWGFENAIITPHNSFLSDKISERLFDLIFKNLRCFSGR